MQYNYPRQNNIQSLFKFESTKSLTKEDIKCLRFNKAGSSMNLTNLKPRLSMVASRPAIGKTMFTANFLHYLAKLHNKKALIFSLEICEEVFIKKVCKTRNNPNLIIVDRPGLSVAEITKECRKIISKEGETIGMIMIDSFQFIDEIKYKTNFTFLKMLAIELGVPVFILYALDSELEQRENNFPLIEDIKLPLTSFDYLDEVRLLYRDDAYKEQTERAGLLDISVYSNKGFI